MTSIGSSRPSAAQAGRFCPCWRDHYTFFLRDWSR